MNMQVESEPLKIGDTVSLRSGGHIMTVISIDQDGITCAWSVRDDVKSKSLPRAALIKASKPQTLEELLSES
ncbi:YodC family protein [Bradyrhizobium sp. ISRA443]|uniref:hypothetical protein n=1 Tax=unclassified Bradyrhizobium TaxID=2631580 RepID=UPI002478760B|nr:MULTISPECIES: hypothetical protein [unclassified Bradyrhizobium]WGR99626.1 YodC family protein [Bradyrhizobium sp. ISRA436]WGS06516.1 YodC family protein [Bradyrhizobium sp. ISRA437]WGS13400.1 YodC family protein [Bradyrhizobium sp. ISRA443]